MGHTDTIFASLTLKLSDDLDILTGPKCSEDVPVYQKQVSKCRLSKVTAKAGHTDRQTH